MAGGANTALGTLTVVENRGLSGGNKDGVLRCTLVGDADYNTTGTPGFLAKLKLGTASGGGGLGPGIVVDTVVERGLNGGYRLIYDDVNDKLLCEVKESGVEVADGTSLAGTTFHISVFYR